MMIKIIPDVISSKQPVCTVASTTSVCDAAKTLCDAGQSAAVVVNDEGQIEGIITENDFMCRVVAKALSPESMRVADIMTPAPDVLQPGDTVLDALELMRARRYHHLAVVDDDGALYAMVTLGMLAALVEQGLRDDIDATAQTLFAPS